MKHFLCLGVFVTTTLATLAAGTAAGGTQTVFKPTTRVERMAAKVLSRYSEKELRELQGFFAPVVKKWRPTAEQFAAEYASSTNKNAVLMEYLPKARAVIDDARKMAVPAKYTAQRDGYVSVAEALYSMVALYLSMH